jgi:hypothetical protein
MWFDANTVVLEWSVAGDRDVEGAEHTNPLAGVLENLDYLRTNLYAIPGTSGSTRTCVLHLPGGGTRTGSVQVRDFDFGDFDDGAVTAVTEIYLPAGALA